MFLIELQVNKGRRYVREHLDGARSWDKPLVEEVVKNGWLAKFDFFRVGMVTKVEGKPIKKRGRTRCVQNGKHGSKAPTRLGVWKVAAQKRAIAMTHDKLHQRFKVISTVLKRASVLQDPDDFAEHIRNVVQPSRNMEMVVMRLHGAYNWQQFFQPLEEHVGGLAATPWNLDVCHSKRCIARRDIGKMDLPGWEIQTPEIMAACTESPHDVVL